MSTATVPVLADLLPKSRLKDAALVIGGAALAAAASQIAIPLWFTPVPLSLATFAVLLVGTSLGPARAALSLGLFALAGVLGAPVFAGFSSGWQGASFGYVLGYIAAALAVGALARRRGDRTIWSAAGTAIAGSALVYAFGVPWLMAATGLGFGEALALGVLPFLAGDAIKAAAASALLPAARKAVGHFGE